MSESMNTYITDVVIECLPEFKHICRICCIKTTEDMLSVFAYIKFRPHKWERMQLFKIADLIMSVSKVKVESSDSFPKEICDMCLNGLKKCVIFKHQIEHSNSAFEKHVKKKTSRSYCKIIHIGKNEYTNDEIKADEEIKENEINDNVVTGNEELKQIIGSDKESIASEDMEVEYLDEEFCQSTEENLEYISNDSILEDISDIIEHDEVKNIEESYQNETNENSNNNVTENNVNITFDDVERNLEELFNGEKQNEVENVKEPPKVSNLTAYNCGFCTKTFLTPNLLTLHMIQRHKYLSVFSCVYPNCNENFLSSAELEEHNILHLNDHNEKIQCKICSKLFATEEECKNHTESHVGNKFKCNICSKILHNEHTLKTHKYRHEKNSMFLCVKCGKSFVTKGELETHHSIHSEQKEYECCICDKKFKWQTNLYAHRKTHFESNQHLCPKCGISFQNNSNLEVHMLRHAGYRNFKCVICDRSFFTSNELKVHVRLHTGESMYSCDVCGWTFQTSNALKIHKAKHEDIGKQFTCELCNESFYKSGLKEHLKLHTGM